MANFYSNCTTLALNCFLYTDAGLLGPAAAGYHSDGINCYQTDDSGKIIAVTTCTIPCDLVIGTVITTDPTILGGTNGTATINYTTTHGPSTYTLNGVAQGAAANPLVVTGLSSSILYTVEITDSNACTASTPFTLGQSATVFDADWLMVTYEFTDGLDLDTRTRIAIPDIGQDTQPEYLGWSCLGAYPTTGIPILTWGGDNTGVGFESVLVNILRFKELYPTATQFTVDLRGFWFNTLGTNPVNAAVTLWKGGTPVKDGCLVVSTPYCWTNPTAAFSSTLDSVPKVITLAPTSGKGTSAGERVATMKYDLINFIAVLNNADTTTPVVPGSS